MKQVILVNTESEALEREIKKLSVHLSRDLQYFFVETPNELLEHVSKFTVRQVIYQVPHSCAEIATIMNNVHHLYKAPILALVGSQDTEALAFCLDYADDFVRLPFNDAEFLARSRALLQRPNRLVCHACKEKQFIAIHDSIVYKGLKRVFVKDIEIIPTTTELKILLIFVSRPDMVFSREYIYTSVWEGEYGEDVDGLIKEHIHRLRKKLNEHTDVEIIQNIRGAGYCITSENSKLISFIDVLMPEVVDYHPKNFGKELSK